MVTHLQGSINALDQCSTNIEAGQQEFCLQRIFTELQRKIIGWFLDWWLTKLKNSLNGKANDNKLAELARTLVVPLRILDYNAET